MKVILEFTSPDSGQRAKLQLVDAMDRLAYAMRLNALSGRFPKANEIGFGPRAEDGSALVIKEFQNAN